MKSSKTKLKITKIQKQQKTRGSGEPVSLTCPSEFFANEYQQLLQYIFSHFGFKKVDLYNLGQLFQKAYFKQGPM